MFLHSFENPLRNLRRDDGYQLALVGDKKRIEPQQFARPESVVNASRALPISNCAWSSIRSSAGLRKRLRKNSKRRNACATSVKFGA